MKKIIALVLCLIMALSLCTIAMADTQETAIAKCAITDAYGVKQSFTTGATKIVKTLEAKVDDGTKVTVTPASFSDGTVSYYECDKSCATAILTVDGVDYFVTTVNPNNTYKTATALYEAKAAAAQTCGDYVEDSVVVDGKYYVLDKSFTNTALLNGKAVGYADPSTLRAHTFTATATTDAAAKTATAKCTVCKQIINLTYGYASFDGNTYVAAPGLNGYYYVAGTVAATTEATTAAVSSAKTFDAGVAMYVGMSIMAAAGSAVVIGKKKEF